MTNREKEEFKAITSIKVNANYFFSYAKKIFRTCAPNGALTTPSKQIEENPLALCKLLAEQYQSVFHKPDETKNIINPHTLFFPPTSPHEATTPGLQDINFTK